MCACVELCRCGRVGEECNSITLLCVWHCMCYIAVYFPVYPLSFVMTFSSYTPHPLSPFPLLLLLPSLPPSLPLSLTHIFSFSLSFIGTLDSHSTAQLLASLTRTISLSPFSLSLYIYLYIKYYLYMYIIYNIFNVHEVLLLSSNT